MNEIKTFCKVCVQRTIRLNSFSLIAEENILNVSKGRVIKTISGNTLRKMEHPFMVLVTVTKKGTVLIDPVLISDVTKSVQNGFFEKITTKKGAVRHDNLTI